MKTTTTTTTPGDTATTTPSATGENYAELCQRLKQAADCGEPWHRGTAEGTGEYTLATRGGMTIGQGWSDPRYGTSAVDTAERIAASVNVCAGISTQQLRAVGTGALAEIADAACTAQRERAELRDALAGLFEHCAMVHKHWGEGCNQREADAAIAAGLALLAKLGQPAAEIAAG